MGRENVLRFVLALCLAVVGVAVVLGLLSRAQNRAYAAPSQPARPSLSGSSSAAEHPPRTTQDSRTEAPLAEGTGSSNPITVCKATAATCAYTSVQEAVNAAGEGDTILVAAGTYTNSDDTAYVLEISKTLTLRGGYTTTNDWARSDPDANPTILDGKGITRVLFVADGSPTIEGFHIYNGNASDEGGGVFIHADADEPILQRNRIYSNSASYGGGVYINQSSILKNNLIYSNTTSSFNGGGIYVASDDPLLYHNTIYSNFASADGGGGIYVSGGSPVISANVIVSNTNYGVYGDVTVHYSDIWGNTSGQCGGNASCLSDDGNIEANPLFEDASGADFHLGVGSPCVDAVPITQTINLDYEGRVRPFGTQADIGAYEFYTGTCFALARIEGGTGVYTNVQDAVDAASDDDVVKVAGTCTGVEPPRVVGSISQTVYLNKGLTLRGGYTTTDWSNPDPDAFPTTLDAQGQGRVIYVASDATIEHLRITKGETEGSHGGGIYIASDDPTISHNDIYSNAATNEHGGGVYIAEGSPRLYDNHIYSNTAEFGSGVKVAGGTTTIISNTIRANDSTNRGGGIELENGNLHLEENYVHDNTVINYGGGISIKSGEAMIEGNEIHNNSAGTSGGGVYCKGSEINKVTVQGNQIYSNTAVSHGGGLYRDDGGKVTIHQNIFHHNETTGSVGQGGAIYSHGDADTDINNNLIYQNVASEGDGGGIYFSASDIEILNNTIYSNTSGIAALYADGYINSNIIVSNTGCGVVKYGDGNAQWDYNNLWDNGPNYCQGLSSSSNDKQQNPQFLSLAPSSSNFLRIQSNSPCIDAADPDNYSPVDYDGRARPFGPAPDMGAFEYYDESTNCLARVAGGSIYSTVHSAIISATAGSTVKVAGTCTETVTISEELTLQGGYHVTAGVKISTGLWTTPTIQTILDGSDESGPVLTITTTEPVTVDRFVIRGAASSGISVTNALSPTVQNVILHSNQGGGFRSEGGGRLYNNTVVSNSGDGLTFAAGAPVVSNTIVVSNTGDAIATTSAITLAYSNVWENTGCNWDCSQVYSDTNSFSQAPLFRDPAAGDFQLGLESPCVNAGDPNTALAWDFEGSQRPLPESSDDYDIGADEGDRYYGVSFTGDSEQGGIPDRSVIHTHNLFNAGSEEGTFDLEGTLEVITGDETLDWQVAVPSPVNLGSNEGQAIPVTVTVPADALQGDAAVATITATLQADPSVQAVVTNTTVVSLYRDVSLTPHSASESVNPDEAYVYEHMLKNEGNAPDTFTVTKLADTYGWAVVTPTEKTLPPRASASIFVSVTVPLTMPATDPAGPVIPGQTVITVTNNRAGSELAGDTVTDTTEVNNPPGDRYVAPGGSDSLNNCRDYANPCRTIDHAVGQATNNDTIKVKNGTYNEHDIRLNKDVTLLGEYASFTDTLSTSPTVVDAQGTGRVFNIFAEPTIERFTIQGGTASGSGGGVYIGPGAGPVLRTNVITGNVSGRDGGGIYNRSNASNITIERNRISANQANRGGGFANETGNPGFWNNMIYQNTADGEGGGVYVGGGSPNIWHDTVYSNTADESGGGIYLGGGSPVVSNTIVVSNSAPSAGGVYSAASGASFAYTNDVWGNENDEAVGLPSDAYTSTNPLLKDNLRLSEQSPLIDQGSATTLLEDFDGQPRTMGPAPDLGADEYLTASLELVANPPQAQDGYPDQTLDYTFTLGW